MNFFSLEDLFSWLLVLLFFLLLLTKYNDCILSVNLDELNFNYVDDRCNFHNSYYEKQYGYVWMEWWTDGRIDQWMGGCNGRLIYIYMAWNKDKHIVFRHTYRQSKQATWWTFIRLHRQQLVYENITISINTKICIFKSNILSMLFCRSDCPKINKTITSWILFRLMFMKN